MRVYSLVFTIFFSFLFCTNNKCTNNCYNAIALSTNPSTLLAYDESGSGFSYGFFTRDIGGFNNSFCNGINRANFGRLSLVSKEDVMSKYNVSALKYVSFENSSGKEKVKLFSKMSLEYCDDIIICMNELINKFNKNKQFRKEISKWKNAGEFETTKHKKKCWGKFDTFKLLKIRKREKHHAITKFAEDMKSKANEAKDVIRNIERQERKKISIIEKDLATRANLDPSAKIINRLAAVKDNLSCLSKKVSKNYSISRQTESLLDDSGYSKKLQNCFGNTVQQNIHSEIVDSLNNWSQLYYSNININNINNYSQLVSEGAKKAIEFKESRDYKEAYFFSDFCSGVINTVKHGVLGIVRETSEKLGRLSDSCKGLLHACANNEAIRTAGYFMQRLGYGLEDSKVDILNCIKKAEASLSGGYYEPLEHEVRDSNVDIGGWREGAGNFLQCASRALGDSTAIFCSALAVACIAEAFLPVIVAGISTLAPSAISISGGGTVAVVAGQSISIGESITAAATRIAPLAGKLVEGCAHFFSGEKCGRGVDKPVGDSNCGGNDLDKSLENLSGEYSKDIVMDTKGNSLDLNYFRRLKKIDTPIKVGRNGSKIPKNGEPNSVATTTGGHKIVYNSKGEILYDISKKRIKVYVRNTTLNGRVFINKGSETKMFFEQIPEKLLKILGIL